ncbi:hypothetical protein [Microbacterium enclense]|uniref:hypothetical protein n=1 Tax=Microbacterium enclense TaxID=993073 RepID=UPI003F8140AB
MTDLAFGGTEVDETESITAYPPGTFDEPEVEERPAEIVSSDAGTKAPRQGQSAANRQLVRKAIEKYLEVESADDGDLSAAALVLGCRPDAADIAVAVLSAPRVPTKLLDRIEAIAASDDQVDAVVAVMALETSELKKAGAFLASIGVPGSFGGETTKQVKAIARAAFEESALVQGAATRVRTLIRK